MKRINTDEPLDEFFAGPGGRHVVLSADGTIYGPFHNYVVAACWRDDAEVGGRVITLTHPFQTRLVPE